MDGYSDNRPDNGSGAALVLGILSIVFLFICCRKFLHERGNGRRARDSEFIATVAAGGECRNRTYKCCARSRHCYNFA